MSKSSLNSWYAAKAERYYGGARRDWLEALAPTPGLRILEIGCGDGSTGAAALEAGVASHYCGVELMPGPASLARQRLNEVIEGNIEHLELPWEPEAFDAVLASEVLEHLVDPWKCVERLARLLKPGGRFFASSPNVCHHRIIRQLLWGRFDLQDVGPMDRTHLRWFTPKSYREVFESAGLRIARVSPVAAPSLKSRLLGVFLPASSRACLWRQIDLRATKPEDAG